MPAFSLTRFSLLSLCAIAGLVAGETAARGETWDYTPTAKAAAAVFTGQAGKVVPMGDSITYASQSSRWARMGTGRTPEEDALCAWMRAGKNDASNGWWLAANDQPSNRSWTAASGVTSKGYIQGGKGGLPALADLLQQHKPQIALVLLGTNDVLRSVPAKDYLASMEEIYNACLASGALPVVTTIPPTSKAKADDVQAYNDGLHALAARLKLPFLDLHGEFMRFGPDGSWQQNLLSPDGIHLSAEAAAGPATEENLRKSGALLKCVSQTRKVLEIKTRMKW
jgi:lysophospholipase L1-like esterase